MGTVGNLVFIDCFPAGISISGYSIVRWRLQGLTDYIWDLYCTGYQKYLTCFAFNLIRSFVIWISGHMTRLPLNAMEGKQSPTLNQAHMKGRLWLRPKREVLFVVKNSFCLGCYLCFLDYLCCVETLPYPS